MEANTFPTTTGAIDGRHSRSVTARKSTSWQIAAGSRQEGKMFELETTLKAFGPKDDEDIDIPVTLGEGRDIQRKFIALRQTLRRIVSLDDKNVPKYAKQI